MIDLPKNLSLNQDSKRPNCLCLYIDNEPVAVTSPLPDRGKAEQVLRRIENGDEELLKRTLEDMQRFKLDIPLGAFFVTLSEAAPGPLEIDVKKHSIEALREALTYIRDHNTAVCHDPPTFDDPTLTLEMSDE